MRFPILTILLFFILYTLYPIPYTSPVFAQCIQNPYPRIKDGLISTPAFSGTSNFGSNTGECVISNLASLIPDNVPTYDSLKSRYYTQTQATQSPPNGGATISSPANNTVYNYTNAAGVSVGPLTYTGTAVIFIDNSLSITGDITGSINGGLVFVVGGDVNIAQNVTTINAVIISSGTIYTAGAGCSTNITPANKLTINGSLISIYKDQPQTFSCTSASPPAGCPKINFCRTLNNNFNPAEEIIIQPKYLVILKDLFADTVQKWSEIQ